MEANKNPDTILVVDDNSQNLRILFDFLNEAGFEVLVAEDGESALKQLDYVQPGLILLDVMMPGIDGFETCRRLKAADNTRNIPVIFITALNETMQKVQGFDVGAVDYITKPIQPEELLARVTTHLKIRNLQQALRAKQHQLEQEVGRRKWISDALKESRQRYRLLTEHATDIIAKQTIEGTYQYVSPACKPILGYEIEEMLNHQIFEFIHPDEIATIKDLFEAATPEIEPITLTYRAKHKDGYYIWLETRCQLSYDPLDVNTVEIITVSRDITARKETQEALKKAHQLLEVTVQKRTSQLAKANALLTEKIAERKRTEERIQVYSEELKNKNEALSQLDKLKDQFLANTSHELRTPINGIIGITELMLEGAVGDLTPDQKYNLSMILSSSRRLANLVNDLLDFSSLKNNKLKLYLEPLDLHSLIDMILALAKPLIGNKEVLLINNISPATPPVYADPRRVQQILHNLIDNAVKFTLKGTITTTVDTEDGHLKLNVVDTGIGIPPEKLDVIFDSFEQADSSISRLYGGSGLGLSITKQLVELHGGKIDVKSTVGQGSCFSIFLPLYKGRETPKRMTLNASSIATITPIVNNIQNNDGLISTLPSPEEMLLNKASTILVVDDEPVNNHILTSLLSIQNYSVITAMNGSEALEMLNIIKPDLILLDVMMPKISGYEVCRTIRESHSPHELPIILLTAKNQIPDLVTGFEVGASDYLTKPFDKNELLARVKSHLHLAKVNAAYQRFVPQEFLKFLGKKSITDVNLGDHVQQEMTVLFSDIRAFTSLSESMSPQESFNFLNEYLKRVSPVVRQYGGFIDKYIGDSIMALFPEDPSTALQAAIAIEKEVSRYNHEQIQHGLPQIAIGSGLHTGRLVLGTIGEVERMESTVISDAVNLASRMEGLTKIYGVNIVISERTLFNLDRPTQYHFRFLDRVKVKGKNEAISVFEIFDGDTDEIIELKLMTRTDFEKGLLHYHSQEFAKAIEYFEEVLKYNKIDKATQLYLQRADYFLKHGVPPDWEGIEALTEK